MTSSNTNSFLGIPFISFLIDGNNNKRSNLLRTLLCAAAIGAASLAVFIMTFGVVLAVIAAIVSLLYLFSPATLSISALTTVFYATLIITPILAAAITAAIGTLMTGGLLLSQKVAKTNLEGILLILLRSLKTLFLTPLELTKQLGTDFSTGIVAKLSLIPFAPAPIPFCLFGGIVAGGVTAAIMAIITTVFPPAAPMILTVTCIAGGIGFAASALLIAVGTLPFIMRHETKSLSKATNPESDHRTGYNEETTHAKLAGKILDATHATCSAAINPIDTTGKIFHAAINPYKTAGSFFNKSFDAIRNACEELSSPSSSYSAI